MYIKEGALVIGDEEIRINMPYKEVKSIMAKAGFLKGGGESGKLNEGKDLPSRESEHEKASYISCGKQSFYDMDFDMDLYFSEGRLNRAVLTPRPASFPYINEGNLLKNIEGLAQKHRESLASNLGRPFYRDSSNFYYLIDGLLIVSSVSDAGDHYGLSILDALTALAAGRGYALVSRDLLENGGPISYMYFEQADNADDSGWRFFSGRETNAYINDPDNIEMMDLGLLAAKYPDVLPYLMEEEPASFESEDADSASGSPNSRPFTRPFIRKAL